MSSKPVSDNTLQCLPQEPTGALGEKRFPVLYACVMALNVPKSVSSALHPLRVPSGQLVLGP
jgi:hypothetical protein